MKIWKFTLSATSVEMPAGARLLSAGVQDHDIVVWALVDPYAERVWRRIAVVPTGGAPPAESGGFLATVTMDHQVEGRLVFHLFDRGEEPE